MPSESSRVVHKALDKPVAEARDEKADQTQPAKPPSADSDKTKRSTSLWAFLNSSFGVFLLSSVVLGALSFSYTQWRDYTAHKQAAEQLDLEIALRIQAMEKMSSSADKIRYSNLVNISDVINGNTKVHFYVRKPLFNDSESKSLTTLLWQLYLLVPTSERSAVKEAILQIE
jgi:hypothetical protein